MRSQVAQLDFQHRHIHSLAEQSEPVANGLYTGLRQPFVTEHPPRTTSYAEVVPNGFSADESPGPNDPRPTAYWRPILGQQ